MAFWNERYFFRKIEQRTGKELISMYPPESPIEIYDRDYWWSDAWDPMSFGKDVDWSRPFLAQLRELQLQVPMPTRAIVRAVNSDYCNNAADLKDCYLTFNADQSEECMYCVGINTLKNSLETHRAFNSDFLYECVAMAASYQCRYSHFLTNCRNVQLSFNCQECSDCVGCVNLRHKKYHIFNVPYSKEEYEQKVQEMRLDTLSGLKKAQAEFEHMLLRYPRKYMSGIATSNYLVSGDFIAYSKNVQLSHGCLHSENLKYCQLLLLGAKDSYDFTCWGNKAELVYESACCGEEIANAKFSYECSGGITNVEYSMACVGGGNLFGCVGLRNKQYCILNRQYSKEEYEAIVPKLREHMRTLPYVDARGLTYAYGEFFPMEFSVFAANETVLTDYAAIDEAKARAYGLPWRQPNQKEFAVTKKASELPDAIGDAADGIVNEIIACEQCSKAYRIVPKELQFLRRFGIPLPRQCFNCRQVRRVNLRTKPFFRNAHCQCTGTASANGVYANIAHHAHSGQCPEEFIVAHPTDTPCILYCEACYNAEVV